MNRWLWAGLALALTTSIAPACSICNPEFFRSNTIRQEAETARLILFGTAENPADQKVLTTNLRIDRVLKNDPFLKDAKFVTLPRFLPITDPKNPPRVVVFCDVFNDKLDIYRGVPCQSEAMIDYVKGALGLDPKDKSAALRYYFGFLEHADRPIAEDAFLEFAKASDVDIGSAAPKFDPAKIREWIKNEKTPAYRLNVYALLLGACGTEEDATLLRKLADNPRDEVDSALDGVLAGYIQLKPKEGWALTHKLLADEKKSFLLRFAALRTLRFFHGWKSRETKPMVLRGMELVVPQGDIADLAVEDLRRWQMWDLTPLVLAQFEKKSHEAPIMLQTIARYAVCSAASRPESAKFVEQQRKTNPKLIEEVEDSLKYEKPTP